MISIEQVPPYVVWPLRHEVMYPDIDFESIKLPEDEEGIHFALFEGNTLISVLSLFREGNDLQFRKFATLSAFQGKGYGSKLLNFVLDFAEREAVGRIWCNARRSAASFYQRFGFNETDRTFFKDGIDFVIMERYLSPEKT